MRCSTTSTEPRIRCARSRARGWRGSRFSSNPKPGRKRGKKINVVLCSPTKCNLRGKTEKERLLLNKYLKAWGLLRGAEG